MRKICPAWTQRETLKRRGTFPFRVVSPFPARPVHRVPLHPLCSRGGGRASGAPAVNQSAAFPDGQPSHLPDFSRPPARWITKQPVPSLTIHSQNGTLGRQPWLRGRQRGRFGRDNPIFRDQTSLFHRQPRLVGHETSLLGHGTSLVRDETPLLRHGTSLVSDETSLLGHGTSLIRGGNPLLCHGTSLVHDGTSLLGDETSFLHDGTGLVELETRLSGLGAALLERRFRRSVAAPTIKRLALAMLNLISEPEAGSDDPARVQKIWLGAESSYYGHQVENLPEVHESPRQRSRQHGG